MTDDRRHPPSSQGYAMLLLVLVIAFIGVMIGLGRQKTYEYQVRRRLDRTYQMEKMLAVRDALSVANTSLGGGGMLSFTNDFTSLNFAPEQIRVVVEPVLPVDRQLMERDSIGNATSAWRAVSAKAGVSIRADADLGVFRFSAPTNGGPHRAAMVKKAVCPWFDSQFGYMYLLDLYQTADRYNLGKLRLYLIGISHSILQGQDDSIVLDALSKHYDEYLAECPWFRMELSMDEADLHPVRTIQVHDENRRSTEFVFERRDVFRRTMTMGTNVTASGQTSLLWITNNVSDSVPHPGGFLLSSTAFCGIAENASHTKLFSPRWDLTRNCAAGFNAMRFTNAFDEAVIAVEHVFPTILPTNAVSGGTNWNERTLTVESFVMQEPLTYTVRAFNKKLAEKDPDVVTWIFQTREPEPDQLIPGKQCVLDTFGREPSDLVLERRGEMPPTGRAPRPTPNGGAR